jgi:protein MAK11
LVPEPRTKIHQVRFLSGELSRVVALTTEDGRIMFFNKTAEDLQGRSEVLERHAFAQLGGKDQKVEGRIKDFETISEASSDPSKPILFITGSSDGAVRFWRVEMKDLLKGSMEEYGPHAALEKDGGKNISLRQIGELVGIHETGHRITCLTCFLLSGSSKVNDAER